MTESLSSKEIVERFLLDAFGERCANPYSPMCAKCVAWDHFDNWRPPDEPSAGVKCTHCNGKGYNEPIYDEQDGWTDETPCETCNGSGRITTVEQYLKTLPANWHEDSSLETWFPITAEELKRLKDERASQPPTTSPFEFCVFIGDPPSGYASWSDWAAEPTKRYVTIRASETKDAPRLCPHGMPLEENICGPCSQGRPNRRADVIDITCDEDDERVIESVFVRDDICVKGQSVTKDAG